MKRQGLIITIGELTKLKMELIEETQLTQKRLGIKNWSYVDYNKKFQLNIINKKGLSDTWEFER